MNSGTYDLPVTFRWQWAPLAMYSFQWSIRYCSTTTSCGTRRGAIILLYIYIYDLFELCIRCRSTTRSRGAIRGTRLFFCNLFVLIYLNFASAAAPQQEVAVPDGTPDFFMLWVIYFILFEWCIRCRSTTRNQGTRRGARLLVLIYFDLSYLWH